MSSKAAATELVEGTVSTDLVPSTVEYFAVIPRNIEQIEEPLPLILNLHGGGGNREALKLQHPNLEKQVQEGVIPPSVIAMPSVSLGCMYMDFRDGSQNWESLIVGPLLTHLRDRFNTRKDASGTFISGVSMGGMGSLRIAFKHPEIFGAVAALEPAIEPITHWAQMRPKHRFYRLDEAIDRVFGNPVDPDHWEANNPATIATRNGRKIRASGLKIYIEAGDADTLWLYEGAEFLHRVLWEQKIRHEYRLYYDADHVGPSLEPRMNAAFEFLGEQLKEPVQDSAVSEVRRQAAIAKQALDEADHYGNDAHLVSKSK